MTVRMDQHDLKAVINGMYQTREAFDKSQQDEIDRIILKLIDFCERMKPCRRAKICLESGEARMVLLCLNGVEEPVYHGREGGGCKRGRGGDG